VLDAFEKGADGVLIGGCHTPNDCHYLTGNFKAFKRYLMLGKMLEEAGVETERLRLEWISATEGRKLAEVVTEFVEEIQKLGPLKR
jgi:F420-non-reducing hydrogenase iron-sulfur subunit